MNGTPEFADWLAICNLKAAYCRLLDTKDWDGWAQLFTEGCRFDTTGSGGSVVDGRDAMVGFVRQSLSGAQTAHQVHAPEMTVVDADTVDVIWAMQDRIINGEWSLTGFGHYHERCVRTDAGWKIDGQKLTRLITEMNSAGG